MSFNKPRMRSANLNFRILCPSLNLSRSYLYLSPSKLNLLCP